MSIMRRHTTPSHVHPHVFLILAAPTMEISIIFGRLLWSARATVFKSPFNVGVEKTLEPAVGWSPRNPEEGCECDHWGKGDVRFPSNERFVKNHSNVHVLLDGDNQNGITMWQHISQSCSYNSSLLFQIVSFCFTPILVSLIINLNLTFRCPVFIFYF